MSEKTIIPRIVIAALKGGAGKTLLTTGIAGALRKRGMSPAVFKKGPDYIDAGWLGLAADTESRNLDTYLMDRRVVVNAFIRGSKGKDTAIIEGNRGLFDGVDAAGSYSTAELAKLLHAPVVLIVDATKVTRTAAAMVLGCRLLDPDLDIRGVILNRVAGNRHENVLRQSIEEAVSIPVIGSVKKLSAEIFPQRHLGLVPLQEHPRSIEFIDEAAKAVSQSINLDKLLEIAATAGPLESTGTRITPESIISAATSGVRIGILKDSAFQFYYPENLEALSNGGAELIQLSALMPGELPDLDALYIGGGFPETHAALLAENERFRNSVRNAVEAGLPVYAECGGLMYLSRSLRIDDNTYPMVGVFPVDSVLERNPQGHGYLQVEVTGENPFYPLGATLTGHEFHYSYVAGLERITPSYAFHILRGHGMDGVHDGLSTHNVLGTYLHVHALSDPLWAAGILRRAALYRAERSEKTGGYALTNP